MMADCVLNTTDTIVLVSADSDLVPPLEFKRRFRDAIMPDVVTDGTKRYEVPEKWRPANIVNSSKD